MKLPVLETRTYELPYDGRVVVTPFSLQDTLLLKAREKAKIIQGISQQSWARAQWMGDRFGPAAFDVALEVFNQSDPKKVAPQKWKLIRSALGGTSTYLFATLPDYPHDPAVGYLHARQDNYATVMEANVLPLNQRSGIGRALFDSALNMQNPDQTPVTYIEESNNSLRKSFQALGFVATDTIARTDIFTSAVPYFETRLEATGMTVADVQAKLHAAHPYLEDVLVSQDIRYT